MMPNKSAFKTFALNLLSAIERTLEGVESSQELQKVLDALKALQEALASF